MREVRAKTVTFGNDGQLEAEIEKFLDRYEDHRLVSVSVISIPYMHRDGTAVVILEKSGGYAEEC